MWISYLAHKEMLLRKIDEIKNKAGLNYLAFIHEEQSNLNLLILRLFTRTVILISTVF